MIKSVYQDQHEILDAIKKLYCKKGFHVDLTFGNGCFYKKLKTPKLCFDINPKFKFVKKINSEKTPLKDTSIESIVFDPPFLCHIKDKKVNSIMQKRFSGYWHYNDLENHYKKTLAESSRILKRKGVLIFKCQDIIHNHKIHPTHINIVNWAKDYNFILKDLFILVASHRIPVRAALHGKQTQRHARIFHSYFLVLELNK